MTTENAETATAEMPTEQPRTGRDVWLAVLIIALAALGVRLGYVLLTEARMTFPDEIQYMNIARNFIAGNGLRVSVDSLTGTAVTWDVQRPPVYPLMLVVVLRLGGDVRAVQILQAVLGTLTCLMIYVLAKELMSEWPARIAAGIAAVYPFSVYFTGRMLSETLFLLLFVTAWYFIVRMWRELRDNETYTRWLSSSMLAGLLAAAAALTRSEALSVFILVPVVMLVVGPRRWMGLALGALMVAVMTVGMSPWIARNYQLTTIENKKGETVQRGAFIPTTLKVGESLYESVGPWSTGGPNKENTVWPVEAAQLEHNEYARDRYLREASVDFIRNNPRRTVRLAGVKFLRTWNIFPNYAPARTALLMTVSAVAYIPVMLTAFVGLFAAMKRPRSVLWLMPPVMVLTLVHMIFVGSVRYRLAMMPFVMVLSGVGTWWIVCRVLARRRRPQGTT